MQHEATLQHAVTNAVASTVAAATVQHEANVQPTGLTIW